jgi:hypothetical protein
MKINPRIRHDQVIAQTSRETFVCQADQVPAGGVIVAQGPDRRVLWAELAALGNVAAYIIKEQA